MNPPSGSAPPGPSVPEAGYAVAVRLLRFLSPAFAVGGSKRARGIRGRRGVVGRLTGWARANRDPARPLVWLHAPSVGEGLQARAVLAALRAESPTLQSAFTYFSPSAEEWAQRVGADVADYLPWDVRADVGRVLDALRPSVLAFTKTEVWPLLAREAEARSIPMVLIGGTLPTSSSRLSPLARRLLAPAFSRLHAVHAVSAADAERFAALGVGSARVTVTGDPGVDSAAERVRGADRTKAPLSAFTSNRPRLIAGSTWPADEAVLLGAMREVRAARFARGLQLVIAPHEPDPVHQAGLLRRLADDGFAAASLTEIEAAGSDADYDVVVVDRVGVLAQLYRVGSCAYVGGGFHDLGLHSVLEPAAAGLPICFGPLHDNSLAASDLLAIGAAKVVHGAGELTRVLDGWMAGEGVAGDEAGEAATRYIDQHRGAASRSAKMVHGMIPPRTLAAGALDDAASGGEQVR